MPRGENPAFKERHGLPLPPALKENAFEWWLRAHVPSDAWDKIDVAAYISSDLCFHEDLEKLLADLDTSMDVNREKWSKKRVEWEIQKYEAQRQRFHGN